MYQLFCDSNCELWHTTVKELGLNVIRMPYVVEEEEYFYDMGEKMDFKKFFDDMRDGAAPKTAALNEYAYTEYFEPILARGEDIYYITFSHQMSGTFNAMKNVIEQLKEKYPERKILVVDTLAASMGQGLLVWYACKKRDEGMSLEELHGWVEENKLHLCHWFTVDDLMYLKRGGRVSATTALVGTMLQIKPVLHVDDEGHLINVAKARGRKNSIDALAKKVGELGGGYDNSTMFITHGDCLEDAQYLAAQLKEKYGAKEVLISYVGSVIGSHAGPGTLALFFLGDHR